MGGLIVRCLGEEERQMEIKTKKMKVYESVEGWKVTVIL